MEAGSRINSCSIRPDPVLQGTTSSYWHGQRSLANRCYVGNNSGSYLGGLFGFTEGTGVETPAHAAEPVYFRIAGIALFAHGKFWAFCSHWHHRLAHPVVPGS